LGPHYSLVRFLLGERLHWSIGKVVPVLKETVEFFKSAAHWSFPALPVLLVLFSSLYRFFLLVATVFVILCFLHSWLWPFVFRLEQDQDGKVSTRIIKQCQKKCQKNYK